MNRPTLKALAIKHFSVDQKNGPEVDQAKNPGPIAVRGFGRGGPADQGGTTPIVPFDQLQALIDQVESSFEGSRFLGVHEIGWLPGKDNPTRGKATVPIVITSDEIERRVRKLARDQGYSLKRLKKSKYGGAMDGDGKSIPFYSLLRSGAPIELTQLTTVCGIPVRPLSAAPLEVVEQCLLENRRLDRAAEG
jgi:hypothetical protein